jgi:hypothetical protein
MKGFTLAIALFALSASLVFAQEFDQDLGNIYGQGYKDGYEQAYKEVNGEDFEQRLEEAYGTGYQQGYLEAAGEGGEDFAKMQEEIYGQGYQQGYNDAYEQFAAAGMAQGQGAEQIPSNDIGYGRNFQINSFGYVSFEPLQIVLPDGEKASFYAGSGVPWGDQSKVTLMFRISDAEDRFGGQIGIEKEYGQSFAPRIADTASVWVRPFNWLRLDVGSFENESFQGIYTGTEFSQYIGPTEDNKSSVFQNFKGVNGTGVMVSFTPVKNLFIGALVNPLIGARYDNYDQQTLTAKDVYENGQYAVAYAFGGKTRDIGTARVQYIGGVKSRPNFISYHTDEFIWDYNNGEPSPDEYNNPDNYAYNYNYNAYPFIAANYIGMPNPMSIQAAFAFKMIENLVIDAGFTYPLLIKDKYGSTQRPMKFAIAAEYSGGPLTLGGLVGISFGGWSQIMQPEPAFPDFRPYYLNNYDSIDYGIALNFSASASYAFSFATIGAEFAVSYGTKDKVVLFDESLPPDSFNPEYDNEMLTLGFDAWIMKTMGAASIKIGVAVSVPTKNKNIKAQNDVLNTFNFNQYEKGPMVITIPIVFGYWL